MALARSCLALLLCVWNFAAQAADVALVGLLPGKALVVIDGGKRQTLVVGAVTAEGVKLLALESGEIGRASCRVRVSF